MKEEAPTRKLPPKIFHGAGFGGGGKLQCNYNSVNGGGAAAAVTTVGSGATAARAATNDEILSTLLRINNFDSISSIKDESLDIDLSACVTISGDPTGMMHGNSLSSNDFWRVLDESAQSQLDTSDEGGNNLSATVAAGLEAPTATSSPVVAAAAVVVKQEQASSFSGNFLRPDPPMLCVSPLKKTKAQEMQQRKPKTKIIVATQGSADSQRLVERKKAKTLVVAHVKQEPPEQLLAGEQLEKKMIKSFSDNNNSSQNKNHNNGSYIHKQSNGGGSNINNQHSSGGSSSSHNSSQQHSNKLNNIQQQPTQQSTQQPTISKHSFSLFLSPSVAAKSGGGINATPSTHLAVGKLPPALSVSVVQAAPNGAATDKLVTVPVVAPEPPLFKCVDCGGLLLHGLQEYAVHEAAAHKILHQCQECGKDFENEVALKKHIKTHRTLETRKDSWKKCPDCGKCLKLGSMWMHRKIHSDNKKYGCDICGQKFVQKINLTHHSRVHTAEKPFECPECQKRFQERSHLQRHQKYHAQTRSYRCEKCGKMYKTERCLKVHNLVHLEQRPFACNVCDKSFISNSKLKQHSNIHTGERPFKCNYCPRDFTNFPNWLKHTRRRHKVDHKTGEQLENIPSYCSKKSTKTAAAAVAAKPASAAAAPNEQPLEAMNVVNAATTTTSNNAVTTNVAVKPQPKRKKKVVALAPPALVPPVAAAPPHNDAATLHAQITAAIGGKAQQLDNNNTTTNISTTAKPPKVKRERKQPTPKQVQKSPNTAPPLTLIKKELIDAPTLKTVNHSNDDDNHQQLRQQQHHQSMSNCDNNNAPQQPSTNFPDLHCLSITSAEELIMEQALEMEECGLYDAPNSSTNGATNTNNKNNNCTAQLDTDNAVSAESAAALHFKIKKEFIEEEFISLTDVNKRTLCPSLESSPYSSPASIEFGSSGAAAATAPPSNTTASSNNRFYMPSFRLNTIAPSSNASMSPTTSSATMTISNGSHATTSALLLQAMQQQLHAASQQQSQLSAQQQQQQQQRQQQQSQQQRQHQQSQQHAALLNQLYVPNSMIMPLLLPTPQCGTQQTLPSVDTLLFTHANSSFFHGKNTAQATAHQQL